MRSRILVSVRLIGVLAGSLAIVLASAATASAITAGTIAGTLRRGDGGAMDSSSIRIDKFNSDGGGVWTAGYASAFTDLNGKWAVSVVTTPGVTYKVMLRGINSSYAVGWWKVGRPVFLRTYADTVTVPLLATVTCDATLPVSAAIEGTVTAHATGLGIPSLNVSVYGLNPATGQWECPLGVGTVGAPRSGFYTYPSLLPGTYRLQYGYGNPWLLQYWNDKPALAPATGIALASGQMASGLNVAMRVNVASETVGGAGRVATSILASQKAYPSGPSTAGAVIITTGWNWPDALGGAALAGVDNAPILLTAPAPAAMPAALVAEVSRLHAKGANLAYILGGPSAVGDAVVSQLGSIFGSNVVRLDGAGRYATADRIATTTILARGASWDGVFFVARGTDYADALAASPVAAKKGWPILLAEPDGSGGLSDRVTSLVDAYGSRAIILGGPNVVSSRVESDLVGALGASKVERWYGTTRVETSIYIAHHAGIGWGALGFANAYGYPDALCGAPLLAKNNTMLYLAPDSGTLPAALTADLNGLAANVVTRKAWFLGGLPALHQPARDALVEGLQ